MKKILPFCLTAVMLLISCNNSTETKTVTEDQSSTVATVVNLSSNFYKKLKGKIGEDIYITADLTKRRDSVTQKSRISGSYYYDKVGMPLNLSGDISDSGAFELNETNSKGDVTVTFKGRFINENEITGTWTNPKNKKQYPFSLKAVEGDVANFNFSEYHNLKCRLREEVSNSTRKDTMKAEDTTCCVIDISLVTLSGNDKVSKKINNALVRTLLSFTGGEKSEESIQQLLHSIDNCTGGDVMEGDYSTGIESNEGNILSMSVSAWANTGGAHGNGVSFYLNFDKRTGDTISLLKIVKPETIDELVARAKQQFVKENGNIKETGWFFEGEFIMPRTFSIGKGGLLFLYQPYEAGPYMMGMPQFFLSWKQIKDIVRPEYLK
jgi:hypothetical protein